MNANLQSPSGGAEAGASSGQDRAATADLPPGESTELRRPTDPTDNPYSGAAGDLRDAAAHTR